MTNFVNKWTNIVMDDGWAHHWPKTVPSLVNNLWWNITMNDWNLDEEAFDEEASDNDCNTINLKFPKISQGIATNVGLTFSVGDTISWFTISIEKTIRTGDTKYHI
jgi:hypothetical protein